MADTEKLEEISDPLDFETPDCVLPSAPTRTPRGFTITTDSYISLCSRVYAATCSKHKEFAKHISESAFQYYAVILLWGRLRNVLTKSVTTGSEFFQAFPYTSPGYKLPIPLQTYLKGIGDFFGPDASDRQLLLPVIPSNEKIAGIRYTFGKVNAKTHFYYEAFPAPAILVLRMLADIEYTKDQCQEKLVWDLPKGLHPDVLESNVTSSKPTKNLLGWAPARVLSEGQLELFESLKINEVLQDGFSISNPGLIDMCFKIHDYFSSWDESNIEDIPGVSNVGPLNPMGSLVQGMTLKKQDAYLKFDRSAMYCEGSFSVCSPWKSNDILNKGAVIAGYRMPKEPIGNKHSWSCYDFDEYESVPESWIRSRNTIYTHGSDGRLNETVYATGPVSKRVLQNNCIQRTMFDSKTSWGLYM